VATKPYRIARQEHLASMLDELQRLGRLNWRWDYDEAAHRAIFAVREPGQDWISLDTRSAEALVQRQCDTLGMRWRPVAHPGGEEQRRAAVAWIEADTP
jgi:hypothetical protein